MSIKKEIVQQIELTKLLPFPDHPFAVRDDEIMQETVESISKYGVLVPAIARPLPDGNYELISGHRRKNACDRAGYKTMPVIVRDLDDDAATIMMVDSNLQRENILPSEKAKAYKMKLEAIKRQGARTDLTSTQFAQKLSVEQVAEQAGVSKDQVRRYIRLTELKPELQQMVDEGKMGMTPAVELSYLNEDEQAIVLTALESEQAAPSLSQAKRIRKLSDEKTLTDDSVLQIMSEQKKPENKNLSFSVEKIRKYFPKSYTPRQMEDKILDLLEKYLRKRQREAER